MELNQYQEIARKTAQYPDIHNNYLFPTLGLVEEAGEVAGKIKKLMRDQAKFTPSQLHAEDISALTFELGDTLWYLTMCASELGLTLEEVAKVNLEKITRRATQGTISGSGDQR